MRINSWLVIISITILWLISSCAVNQSLSRYNFVKMYSGKDLVIKPSFSVYHISPTESEVSLKIKTKGLLYSKYENQKDYKVDIKISYLLYESFTSNLIIDSSSFIVSHINNEKINQSITGKFVINAQFPKRYILRLITRDLNSNLEEEKLVEIDKTSKLNRQNYLIENVENKQPNVIPQITNDKAIRITYNNRMTKRLIVKYYNREFPVSPPPFMDYNTKRFNFEPDSFYYVNLDSNNSFITNLDKLGLYQIQNDSSSNQGLTLSRVDNFFPTIKTHESMIPSLRFISTNKEYKNLKNAENIQDVIDEFWLDRCSSSNKSRDLLKTFYNRVENTNEFFTSHVSGWKSDRGLIYIIFGAPDYIYRSMGNESWVYSSSRSKPNLNFNFTKTFNPFSDNDYRLNRSPEYKSYWYNAVDTWRQGHAYKY